MRLECTLVSAGSEIYLEHAQRVLEIGPDNLQSVSQPLSQQPTNFAERVISNGGIYTFTGRKWASNKRRPQAASIVFLHGFLGQAADWDPIAAALSVEENCFALNLPGHCGSHFRQASTSEDGTSENGNSAQQFGKYHTDLPTVDLKELCTCIRSCSLKKYKALELHGKFDLRGDLREFCKLERHN